MNGQTMNSGSKPIERIQRIITDYIKPNSHLLAMERIHQNFRGEDEEFNNWTEVLDIYRNINITNEDVREFAQLAKQIVEGIDEISETYFRILAPNKSDLESITEELDRAQYRPNAAEGDRDGFQYEVQNNNINGRYIYTDISTEISPTGEVNKLISEGSIEFKIVPDDNVLITETTSVVDVQKIKSYFKKRTNISVHVYENLAIKPDIAVDLFNEFIDSIEHRLSSKGCEFLGVKAVSLHNPFDDETELRQASFEGNNVQDHPEVRNLIEEGWIPRGGEIIVQFKGQFYDVSFSANRVMSYVKIENIKDYELAKQLMDEMRELFLDIFGKEA